MMKGLILAAGRGTRLRPLTDYRPKPLVPIAGRPILQYNIENLRDAGVTDIVIVVNGDTDEVTRYFGDGTALGVRLTYVAQHELLGTAHAIYQARHALGDSPFLLVFGDNMTGYRLRHLAHDFRRLGGSAMLAVCEGGDPRKHAVVSVEGERVRLIEEKPAVPKGPYTCAGMYALEPSIFRAIEQIGCSDTGEYYLPDALQWLVDQDAPVHFTVADGWRVNINAPTDIMKALAHVVRDMVHTDGQSLMSTYATEVLLGADVRLNSNVRFGGCSYIGSGCHIGSNTHIAEAMLMDRVTIGSDCLIANAILGSGVVVPDGTHVLGEGVPLVIPDGQVLASA